MNGIHDLGGMHGFGEVERAEKDRVSHRGKAFARLRAFLAGMVDGG